MKQSCQKKSEVTTFHSLEHGTHLQNGIIFRIDGKAYTLARCLSRQHFSLWLRVFVSVFMSIYFSPLCMFFPFVRNLVLCVFFYFCFSLAPVSGLLIFFVILCCWCFFSLSLTHLPLRYREIVCGTSLCHLCVFVHVMNVAQEWFHCETINSDKM